MPSLQTTLGNSAINDNIKPPGLHLPETTDSNPDLLPEFVALWEEVDAIWTEKQDEPAFHGYVSADYLAIYHMLLTYQGRINTVLEWGSGLGVVAIMASRMGFDAYGIEAEEGLVELSNTLNEKYNSQAVFAHGSFIPDDFEWQPSSEEDVDRTEVDAAAAYYLIDMEIRDFDLVYAYPWPDEHGLFQSIFQQFSQPGAKFLTYDSREGLQVELNGPAI